MKTRITTLFLITQIIFCQIVFAQKDRGAGNVKVKTANGQTKDVKLYDGSYALVIGNSNYKFWDTLPGVKTDVVAVRDALTANGFTVETASDLASRELSDRIEQFVNDYGFSKNNRLLIYYAGHGHTQKTIDDADERELGFIVPTDAPLPEKDLTGFFRKAVSLEKIRTFAREIQAKHALFLFDSCFSGRLVSRSNVAVPPIVEESVTYPVRQFITAGAANQPVPDESIFRRAFVRALEGEADTNRDGYILGTELAAYLRDKVTTASRRTQTPQYGKIDDIALDRGDFVFTVTGKDATAEKPKTDEPPPTVEIDKNAGEREAWNQIKDGTNRSDFRLFVETFPNGIYAAQARAKWEQVWWDAIKNSQNKADYEAFLKEFPAGQYANAAKFAVKRLEAASANTKPTKTVDNNTNTERTAGAISKSKLPNGAEMSFAYIPAGEFQMGSTNGDDDEKPVHTVKISQGFFMGQTEVTQTQYEKVMGTNPSYFKNCPQCPVEKVSWEDAQQFIAKLNAQNDGYKYRLPTEAEWEYAARSGTTGDYAGNLDSMAWYEGNSGSKTHEVGTKQANGWGLYDMHGNVWEWCEDWYGSYASGTVTDPTGATSGSARVDRGGSWINTAPYLRSADRSRDSPSNRHDVLGFRVVRITL